MEPFVHKKADQGAMISIAAYILLSIVKLGIGYVTASTALQADGLNNVTDIGASVAVLIGLKISRKPRDYDHTYGHSRAEQIASLVASFIMMSVGVNVILNAAKSFLDDYTQVPDILAAWVAALCAAIMYGVYIYNMALAKKTGSKALEAAAKDNLSDMLVSIGTVMSVTASQFAMPIIDRIAAVVIGIIICKTAWDIFKEASHMLTDGIDPAIIEDCEQTIYSIHGVNDIIDMKGRMYGNHTYIDITITVNPHLDVTQSHHITDIIEERLREKHDIQYSHIHVEPAETK